MDGAEVREGGYDGIGINDLPLEILEMIFANHWANHNDVPSLIVSMMVCKKWHAAVTHGVLSHMPEYERKLFLTKSAFVDGVCLTGNIPLLQWAKAHGFCFEYSCYDAAGEGGSKDLIEWLLRNYPRYGTLDAMYIVIEGAARGAHKDLLPWAIEKATKSVHDSNFPNPDGWLEPLYSAILRGAAAGGQKEIFEWICIEKKMELRNFAENITALVAHKGQSEFMEWLNYRCNKVNPLQWKGWEVHIDWNRAGVYAAMNGHVNVLDWLMKNNSFRADSCLSGIQQHDNLKTLNWFLSQPGNDLKDYFTQHGLLGHYAREGKLEIIQWLWRNHPGIFPPKEEGKLLDLAVESNNWEFLQWVVDKGFKPNPKKNHTIELAIKMDAMKITTLDYLIEIGCPFDSSRIQSWV